MYQLLPASSPALPDASSHQLSASQFEMLREVPAEGLWFANLTSPQTRRAYQADLREFRSFVGIVQPVELRSVTRAHVLAWRAVLERRGLSGATIRRKLAALGSLFDYLCENNAVNSNPVDGVRRPRVDCSEGKTPGLSGKQARQLLNAPSVDTLKGLRDRAMLSTLLFHALRRDELASLRVKDFKQIRSGVPHLLVHGKGQKIRFIPVHPDSLHLITQYLMSAGHAEEAEGALFRSLRPHKKHHSASGLSPGAIYTLVLGYLEQIGIKGENMGPHSLRVTAATSALQNNTDIGRVQQWLGHASISTTKMYDRRNQQPQDSPTYRVQY